MCASWHTDSPPSFPMTLPKNTITQDKDKDKKQSDPMYLNL